MSVHEITIIDEGRARRVRAAIECESFRLPSEALRDSLGWEVKPQGLCRGDVCIPIVARARAVNERGVDLRILAELLGRPIALDVEERVTCLGVSAADRGAQLASGKAPEFTLPDLDGRLHSLSAYRGKKVLLVAYASW